jgi:hypothetical protein
MEERPEDSQPVTRIPIMAEEYPGQQTFGIVGRQLNRIDHVPAICSLKSLQRLFIDLFQCNFRRHLRQHVLQTAMLHVKLIDFAAQRRVRLFKSARRQVNYFVVEIKRLP